VIHQFTDALTPEMDEDSGKRDGKPLPTSQRLLPSMLIESEIGRSDRDVLKSVGTQVERLIQDMMEYGKGTCVSYIDYWRLGRVMYNHNITVHAIVVICSCRGRQARSQACDNNLEYRRLI
jgi:hypothetical protein